MFFSQVVGKEIAEKVKDGENALTDVKTKLKEAEDKINSGKRELAENKEKYEREFAEKKKLIANGEKELNKVNKQIKSGYKGLSAGKLKFNEKKREFLNAKTEYEKNLKEYEKKSLELKKAEEKISKRKNSLNYLRVLLEKSKAEYENTLKENNLEKELSVILSEAELELLQLKNLLKNNPGDLTLKKKIAEKEKFIAFIKVLTEKKAELENGFKDLIDSTLQLHKTVAIIMLLNISYRIFLHGSRTAGAQNMWRSRMMRRWRLFMHFTGWKVLSRHLNQAMPLRKPSSSRQR